MQHISSHCNIPAFRFSCCYPLAYLVSDQRHTCSSVTLLSSQSQQPPTQQQQHTYMITLMLSSHLRLAVVSFVLCLCLLCSPQCVGVLKCAVPVLAMLFSTCQYCFVWCACACRRAGWDSTLGSSRPTWGLQQHQVRSFAGCSSSCS
jgi:hypothetical protein